MSIAAPLLLLVIAAALFFAAQRFGWRGALVAVGVPLALMIWLWLALHFHWIEHTGDNENTVALFFIIVWVLCASLVSMIGLAFRKRRWSFGDRGARPGIQGERLSGGPGFRVLRCAKPRNDD